MQYRRHGVYRQHDQLFLRVMAIYVRQQMLTIADTVHRHREFGDDEIA